MQRKTYITIDYGLEGHEKRMWESLNTKSGYIKELFRNHTHFNNSNHVNFVFRYATERVKRNIKIMQLVEPGVHEGTKMNEVMIKKKKFKKEIRIIPKEFKNNNSFRIWGDTVNIISYENQTDFITVTIKDKFIVSLIEDMWDFIWSRSH